MATCSTLTTITKSCDNNIGGIKQVWLWDMEDKDILLSVENSTTWSWDDYALTGGSPATLPIAYEFIRNSSNFVEEGAIDVNVGSSFTRATLTLVFTRREAAKSKSIKLLGDGQRYLGALVLDSNGIYWIFEELQLSAVGDGSGTAKADGSKYTLTLLSEVPDFAKIITDVQASDFITTGTTI